MRLVHLADLHIGYRAYHRTTSQGLNRREADVFQAFREALTKTAELQPDLVVMAGDIFHVPRPGNLALIETQKALLKFRERCQADIVIIAGNHESVKSLDNRCILELLGIVPGITTVTARPEVVSVCGDRAIVSCLPHNGLEQTDALALRPHPDADYNILLLHGTADSNRINDYGGYDVPAHLLSMPWDYVACGHYHSYTHLGGNAYYAGAIERTSNDIWKEADEEKGFIEFDLDTHSVRFHPLASPRATVDLPIIDAAGKEAGQVDAEIADNAKQADVTDKLVRQRVVNLPRSVQHQLDRAQLRSLQVEAVHYLFDPHTPEASGGTLGDAVRRDGGSLRDRAQAFLQERPLPAGIERERFVATGMAYLVGLEENASQGA